MAQIINLNPAATAPDQQFDPQQPQPAPAPVPQGGGGNGGLVGGLVAGVGGKYALDALMRARAQAAATKAAASAAQAATTPPPAPAPASAPPDPLATRVAGVQARPTGAPAGPPQPPTGGPTGGLGQGATEVPQAPTFGRRAGGVGPRPAPGVTVTRYPPGGAAPQPLSDFMGSPDLPALPAPEGPAGMLTTDIDPSVPRLTGPAPMGVNAAVRRAGGLGNILGPANEASAALRAEQQAAAQARQFGSARPMAATNPDQFAALTMGDEGPGPLSRFFGDISGRVPVPAGVSRAVNAAAPYLGAAAKVLGGAGALASGVVQNTGLLGGNAVDNAGPLTRMVEPGLVGMMSDSYRNGDSRLVHGLKTAAGYAGDIGARLVDETGVPSMVGMAKSGLDYLTGSANPSYHPTTGPNLPAMRPVDPTLTTNGGHVGPAGQHVHPTTHNVDDFVNAMRGSSAAQMERIWQMQHYMDPSTRVLGSALQYLHEHTNPNDKAAMSRLMQTYLSVGLHNPVAGQIVSPDQ